MEEVPSGSLSEFSANGDHSGSSVIRIYVDGSCEDNQNVSPSTKAGWGFCVIEGDDGAGRGRGDLVFEAFGPVSTSPEESLFFGAEVGSNNTAELSAIINALRWVLSSGIQSKVEICTDSKYAGNISSGFWKAKANLALVSCVRRFWEEVSEIMPISWRHVRAHRGHRWNERADHLAYRATLGETPVPLQFWKPGQR